MTMADSRKGTEKLSPAKRLAGWLPARWQTELKRLHFARQISKGTFVTNEPEYALLPQLVKPGDWVIDIGANVGHYTKRFSDLVGGRGRVIAFEPVPTTFSILAANVERFATANVSLFNAAVSDRLGTVGMSIPEFASGLANYYQAQISSTDGASLSVLTVSIDALDIDHRIALVKIDTEGHEAHVLAGMHEMVERYKPVLIVETGSEELIAGLRARGYAGERLPNSPNVLFLPAV